MRPLPAASAVMPLLLLSLAGCFGGDGGDGGDGTTSDDTTGPEPEPEDDNAVLQVMFESAGAATVEVPFPSLDACIAPQHWMDGTVTGNAKADLRDADDGRTGKVLAVTGTGSGSWSSQVDLGPPCQNIQYDPWSTEPDPADGTTEVRATSGTVTYASVLVRSVRETCGTATLYEGEPGTGWTALTGRTIPASCG